MSIYLCWLVIGISSDELLSRAAIGGVGRVSVGQRGGCWGGKGAGRRRGGGGGLGVQAVEGVAPRDQHHSHPGQEPAPELILVKQIHKLGKTKKLYLYKDHNPPLLLTYPNTSAILF